MARKISGITIEIDGNTTQLQESLKKVDSQLKNTQTELKNVDRKLKFNTSGTDLLRQKQRDLQTAIKQTEERLDMLKQAQKNVAQGTEEWDKIQREINDTEADLKNLEQQYRDFGSVAAQQIKQVGEEMQKIGGKMQEVGRDMTMYVTLPIVAAGTKAVKSYAEVDKTMQLTNKTMNNTEKEAKELNKAMEEAAANSIFGMEDAATATLNFARAGLDAAEAADALAPAMNLAAGEGGNLDTVSAGLVATINGFQDGFDKSAHYADVFAAACNNSALDVDSLSGAMSTAAPIFKTAGYQVEDAALYMGIMANNGIEASEAANSLKTGIARLVKPSKEGAIAMEKLGINVTNADGSMKDSITIQKELNKAFSGLSESEQIAAASAIFGKNQMSKWLALINTAPKDVQELSDSINECNGTTQEMADTMMGGFGGSIEKLKSSLDVLMTSIGRLIAEYLQPVIDKIQAWVDKFNALDDGTKQTIIKIVGLVAAIGPLLIVGGKLITGIGKILIFAPIVVSAFSGISIAAVGLTVMIASLVAAGIWLIKNWDKIKEHAKKLAESVKTAWENMKNNIKASLDATKQDAINSWNNIKTSVTNAINTLKNNVINAWNNMRTRVVTTMSNIRTSVVTAWNNIKTSVVNAVRNLVTNAMTSFSNFRSRVQSTFESIRSSIVSKIESAKNTVSNIWEQIKSVFDTVLKIHLKVPHVSVDGGEAPWGIGGRGRAPHFDVQWYKKAYDNPMMFTSPTVLATPNGYKGFGDGHGAEIVLGLEKLRELVGTSGGVVINVYPQQGMDVNQLAEAIQSRFVALQKQRSLAYA